MTATTGLDHTFTAPIEKDGSFATYVTVPDSAELLGTRKAVKVTGTIDGQPLRGNAHAVRLGPALAAHPGGAVQGQEQGRRTGGVPARTATHLTPVITVRKKSCTGSSDESTPTNRATWLA